MARRDRKPAPRWTLEYHGRKAPTRSAATRRAWVDAAWSSSTARRSTPSIHGTVAPAPTRSASGVESCAGSIGRPAVFSWPLTSCVTIRADVGAGGYARLAMDMGISDTAETADTANGHRCRPAGCGPDTTPSSAAGDGGFPVRRDEGPQEAASNGSIDDIERLLDEVEDALARLDDGTYGRCSDVRGHSRRRAPGRVPHGDPVYRMRRGRRRGWLTGRPRAEVRSSR